MLSQAARMLWSLDFSACSSASPALSRKSCRRFSAFTPHHPATPAATPCARCDSERPDGELVLRRLPGPPPRQYGAPGASRHPMTPSQKIDKLIAGIADWRGKTFATVRETMLEADP